MPKPPTPNLLDKRFSRLTVVGKAARPYHWVCICDCGARREVQASSLWRGITKSCGCWSRDWSKTGNSARTHGHSYRPEYNIWRKMIRRCGNPKDRGWANYGGRGITVCSAWKTSSQRFIDDMGPRPSPKHSLDRLDNDAGYCPGNCRWATRRQQNSNTRKNVLLSMDGHSLTISEWGRRLGTSRQAIHGRLKSGWSVEDSLRTPFIPRTRSQPTARDQ